MLCNTVKELFVALDKIRGKAENYAFIKKMKMQVRLKERNKNKKYIRLFNMWHCLTIRSLGSNASGTSKENFEEV